MVSIAARRLTGVGFRRDIKFFLACLVGFLVFIILTLLMLLQSITERATEKTFEQWRLVALTAAESLNRLPASATAGEIESQMVFLRGQYGISTITLSRPGQRQMVSGFSTSSAPMETIERPTQFGPATFSFDPAEVNAVRRSFFITASISIVATLLGTILLSLYLPRIVRPIEAMLDEASALGRPAAEADEANYLIATFRNSIQTLKEQEIELKRLHELEKNRADDLQRVTATLTRSLTSGFIAIDQRGRLVDMNLAAKEILRLPHDLDPAGRTVIESLGEGPFARCLAKAVEEGVPVSRQEVVQETGGEPVVIGLTTVPLTDEESKMLGVIALFADLTPVRQLEQRLRDMQTLADLGEISAGIAHEFRNSLSTILGYLKLAGRDLLPDETQKRLRNAEEEATLLSGAVEGLLSFARPMRLEFHEIDLSEVVQKLVDRFREQSRGVEITADLEPAAVQADATLLARAIENLIRNAVDSVREKGEGSVEITVRGEPSPSIRISDNGVGFDPQETARLLLPFQSDKPDGMGLGLPLARKIVMLHGGTLQLTGERGAGAVVTIEFPA